jgi:uncharacterized protein (UPF0276 family)
VGAHIDRVQEVLGRRVLLENPSTYVAFGSAEMGEIDFLSQVVARTGCGLLLDVNNVLVSTTNQGASAEDYIDAFPMAAVGEIHLGGHAHDRDDAGARLLIDAHDRAVDDQVWALFARSIARSGLKPTLIEWDNAVPAWKRLYAEARRADRLLAVHDGLAGAAARPLTVNGHAKAG